MPSLLPRNFLSDQPCVTCATYSLFRGAHLEKGAISDCMVCTKQDGYCQILFVARATAIFLQKSELLLLLPLRFGASPRGLIWATSCRNRGDFPHSSLPLHSGKTLLDQQSAKKHSLIDVAIASVYTIR